MKTTRSPSNNCKLPFRRPMPPPTSPLTSLSPSLTNIMQLLRLLIISTLPYNSNQKILISSVNTSNSSNSTTLNPLLSILNLKWRGNLFRIYIFIMLNREVRILRKIAWNRRLVISSLTQSSNPARNWLILWTATSPHHPFQSGKMSMKSQRNVRASPSNSKWNNF